MGGCVSRPKELDGPKYDSEVSVQPVEADAKPQEQVKAETATEPKITEEPLLDLSESKPEETERSEVVDLAPEISELTVNAPVEPVEKKEEVIIEAEEAKKSEVVADRKESEDKILA